MKLITLGDYYIWYCDLCDSRNQTPWTRMGKGRTTCCGCQSPFTIAGLPMEEMKYTAF